MERYIEQSIREKYSSNREILQALYSHAMKYRAEEKLSYRPALVSPYIDVVNNPGVDFGDIYKGYEEGDYAYFSCYMDGIYEREMLISVKGTGIAEVFFNGTKQTLVSGPRNSLETTVTFRKGKNYLLVRVTASKEGFAVYARPVVPKVRVWPAGYVYYTRMYIESEGYVGQELIRFSRLYRKSENDLQVQDDNIEWVFPIKPKQSENKCFDFNQLCGKGNASYVYTFLQGRITITHDSPLKLYAEKKEIYSAQKGCFTRTFDQNTPLLIKSGKFENEWGFQALVEGETSLPNIEGADCPDLQWLWVGPFGREGDSMEYPYAPEVNLQFERPYQSISEGNIYWQFYRPDTYLKQYLQSAFFGQWLYAPMVGLYGMKQAAEVLKIQEFTEYFMAGIKLLCIHRDYAEYDNKRSGFPSYLYGGLFLDNLDSIGTIGINVAEYYLMTGDNDARCLMQLLADSITYKIPRFEDGTFHRPTTMWTDDMYMSLPFLVRLGTILGNKKYFDDIVTQVKGFYDRMFMKDQGLYAHIFFLEEGGANRIPWGRGNGWVLLALSEVLLLMPENYEGYQAVMKIYQEMAYGVLRHRDKEYGIWHQVVNNPESYLETSGSAMFITALARGIRNGWLKNTFKIDVVNAWEQLTERCIDADGNIYGICMGSGCSMDETYYTGLSTITNDDHGVGIVLGACVAVMDMLGER